MIGLRPLSFYETRARWKWVKTGLQECARRAGERWLPEDIYEPLRAGNAYCYAIVHDERDIGFVIVQRHNDPDGAVLFIWAIWCEPGTLFPVHREVLAELRALAIAIKAVRIRMESPRKGWEWVDFFVPIRTVFEHEVTHEPNEKT